MRFFVKFLSLFMILSMSACTYVAGTNDPIMRKFTWFSYVNGDDIRKVCANLGADRYRFVYNGIYQRQTRSYDVFFNAKKISIQITGPSNLKKLSFVDGLAPWRGIQKDFSVTDQQLATLKERLVSGVALHSSPVGLRLNSDQFYWVVSACVEGEFYFNAYLWPSKRWDQMGFDEVLFAWDETGVSVEEPRVLSPIEIWGGMHKVDPFLLQLGENGLMGQLGAE